MNTSDKKLFKSVEDTMDNKKMINLMAEAVAESIKVMNKWEDTDEPALEPLIKDDEFKVNLLEEMGL